MNTRPFLLSTMILALAAALFGTVHTSWGKIPDYQTASSPSLQNSAREARPSLVSLQDEPDPTGTPPEYTLALNTSGAGTLSAAPDLPAYPPGTIVELTAQPEEGWVFSEWSGDLSGNTNPATILMDGNKSVTAGFTASHYQLSVHSDGSGTVSKDPDQADYQHGEQVTLLASPETGWAFSGWNGDLSGSDNPATITMDRNQVVTGTFELFFFTLATSVNGSGTVTLNPDKSIYLFNEQVSVTAIPATGWHFTGWSGDLSGVSLTETVYMTGNKSITANFKANEYVLTVNSSGSGEVFRDLNRSTYLHGETVDLTARSAQGWSFNGWSGDLSGGTNPASIVMNGNKTIHANFIKTAPSDISLQGKSVEENQPAGTTVGSFSTTDPDYNEAHTYQLVPGSGAIDNASFMIEGNLLKTGMVFDYETKNIYSIRVSTTDITGLSKEKSFNIQVHNVNEAPSALGDPFSIGGEGTLSVNAPGVLENDSDPDNDSLSAVLDRAPEHAESFQLNADGSFVYQPEEAFIGVDTFEYHAFDGALSSDVVAVEINVYDSASPQVEWMAPVGNGDVYDIDSEPVVLEVQAQDDVAVNMVRFYRWDAQRSEFVDIGIAETAPFQWELDPSSLNTGWNQVFAKAYDHNGNESGRVWIWLRLVTTYRLFLPHVYR